MLHRQRKAKRTMEALRRRWRKYGAGGPAVWVILGVGCALLLIGFLDRQMRPLVSELAAVEAHNRVNEAVTRAVTETLNGEAWSYEEMVTVQRDENGYVTALQSNVAAENRLRAQVVEAVLNEVSALSAQDFEIHLGSLTGLDAFSGWGPLLRVRTWSVGKIDAELESVFTSAGINQTRHQIMLRITVPVTIFLASGSVRTEVTVPVCAAETVIVGMVPETYLELQKTGEKREREELESEGGSERTSAEAGDV